MKHLCRQAGRIFCGLLFFVSFLKAGNLYFFPSGISIPEQESCWEIKAANMTSEIEEKSADSIKWDFNGMGIYSQFSTFFYRRLGWNLSTLLISADGDGENKTSKYLNEINLLGTNFNFFFDIYKGLGIYCGYAIWESAASIKAESRRSIKKKDWEDEIKEKGVCGGLTGRINLGFMDVKLGASASSLENASISAFNLAFMPRFKNFKLNIGAEIQNISDDTNGKNNFTLFNLGILKEW